MSQANLKQIGSSALYHLEKPGKDQNLVFLRWSSLKPPKNMLITETWADSGSPKEVGYYNFLNMIPDAAAAAGLEKNLRAGLPATVPKCTGFTWAAVFKSKSYSVDFLAIVAVTPGTKKQPHLVKDVNVTLPKGIPQIGFGADSPVFACRDKSKNILGFTITYPPQPTSMPPNRRGINLSISGNSTGCIQFQGLMGQQTIAGGAVIKTRTITQVDPLQPFNPQRTFTTLTDDMYILSKTTTGYQLGKYPASGFGNEYKKKGLWLILKAFIFWILSLFRKKR